MDADYPALRPGDSGPLVEDLQQRLDAAGHAIDDAEFGSFGACTTAAVQEFQRGRKLVIDGICGRDTWIALVESGYALGDRLLYLRHPMLRGDDVLELQATLNALGFHAGREDGIFGPQTERGLREFQRNMGLATDGQLGPTTRAELGRLATFAEGSVDAVLEREALRTGSWQLSKVRFFIALAPELAVIGNALQRELRRHTSTVVVDISGTDDRELAQRANRFEAGLVLSLTLGTDEARCLYFEGANHYSEVGHRVANAVAATLDKVLGGGDCHAVGRRTTILRETRMPAVVILLAEPGDASAMAALTAAAPELAVGVTDAIVAALTPESA